MNILKTRVTLTSDHAHGLRRRLGLDMVYVPILHRFWYIARYWSNIADFNLPHLHLMSLLRVIPLKFRLDLRRLKTRVPGLSHGVVFCDSKLIRFGTVPAFDGQTDRQTDGQTQDNSIYSASIASRGINAFIKDIFRGVFYCENVNWKNQQIHNLQVTFRRFSVHTHWTTSSEM